MVVSRLCFGTPIYTRHKCTDRRSIRRSLTQLLHFSSSMTLPDAGSGLAVLHEPLGDGERRSIIANFTDNFLDQILEGDIPATNRVRQPRWQFEAGSTMH